MSTRDITTVPLTEGEKNFLMRVYRRRRRLMIRAYALIIPLVIACSIKSLDRISRRSYKIIRWEEQDDAKFVSRLGMFFINVAFLGGAVIGCGVYFYRTRVVRLKRDADSGVKEQIPYTINKKQYFPLTGQYFVWIDDPANLDHEIDEETFYNCEVGDVIYIYRAAHSKFVFEKDGKYEVL